MARLRVTGLDRSGADVSVTITGGRRNEAYQLWVAMKSYDVAELVAAEYLPVRWDQQIEQPSSGTAGPFHPAGARQDVYVWKHPDINSPLAVTNG